jgi:hypothetical protein
MRSKEDNLNKGGDDRNRKVFNPHRNEDLILKSNERFRSIFHPGNVRDIPRPKLKNGNLIYVRYQTLGWCYNDCTSINGHAQLSSDETKSFSQFLKSAREVRRSYDKQGRYGTQRTTKEPGEQTPQSNQDKNPKSVTLSTGTTT